MNKRQKKKLYKKLHGHNPPKQEKRKYKPGTYARAEDARLQAIYPCIRPETRNKISKAMKSLGENVRKTLVQVLVAVKNFADKTAEFVTHPLPYAKGETLDKMAEIYGLSRKPNECDDTLRRRILGEKEPPCIVVAEVLTRKREAEKREKYHTRNRRKRKWH